MAQKLSVTTLPAPDRNDEQPYVPGSALPVRA